MARYIGIDLHRNCFTVCTIAENGRDYFKEVQMDALLSFAKDLRPDDQVAVEMTTNTRLFKEVIEQYAGRVVVVNAVKFKLISKSVKKTDKNDARTLAFFLSKDMLPEVRVKDAGRHELYSLCKTKDKLTKQRTQLKNKLNNIFAAVGVLLPKEGLSSAKALEELLNFEFDSVSDVELEVLVEQIQSLNRSIKKLEKTIEEVGSQYEEHRILKSIKGIGASSASVLLSVIGDVNDFDDEKKLASYFGIVPQVSNSNETHHTGKITKLGSKLGRTTLVQCALIAKMYSPYLHEYHECIKARRGGGKANIALARKLLGIVYLALKNRWMFFDFPRFKYVELSTA